MVDNMDHKINIFVQYSKGTQCKHRKTFSSILKIPFRYLATVGLVGYVCAYSFSFGPVTWVLLSEIFPAATKGRAMAFTTSFNWLGNFIVSATFLQATRNNILDYENVLN